MQAVELAELLQELKNGRELILEIEEDLILVLEQRYWFVFDQLLKVEYVQVQE